MPDCQKLQCVCTTDSVSKPSWDLDGPRQHAGKDHQRIGRIAVAGQPGQAPKDHRKNHHGQEGPQHRPQHADDRLLGAHGHIAPGQDEEKLSVAPEVGPVVAVGAARFQDKDLF